MFYASQQQFRDLGREITNSRRVNRQGRRRSTQQEVRRFKAFFGVKPERASEVWSLLIGHGVMPPKAEPMHLLWALLFLKLYGTDDVNAGLIGLDPDTIRKWVWLMVHALHNLSKKLIKWGDRLDGTANTVYFVSTDATDCPINEPTPFDERWWTKKFNRAGVRYEVALALRKSAIVHINGPYACGAHPDAKIFSYKLEHKLHIAHERTFTDKGYWGHGDVCTYIDAHGLVNGRNSPRMRKTVAAVQARHETVFKRMKQFRILKTKFRHELKLHQFAFRAVAALVQINIKADEPLFHHDTWLTQRYGNIRF